MQKYDDTLELSHPTEIKEKPRKEKSALVQRSVPLETFEEMFPGAIRWDSPLVLDELRKNSIVVLNMVLKGKKIDGTRVHVAEVVLSKMVAPREENRTVHFHLSFADITKARERAGLTSKVIEALPAACEPRPQEAGQKSEPEVQVP